jgi:hypothetical protein
MPTVLLLDVSLSMTRPVQVGENSETTRKHLAVLGINAFLDQLSIHSKLEFISLMAFSSLYEEKCAFTRDYNLIKNELQNIDDYDKTCIETALHGVARALFAVWSHRSAAGSILATSDLAS